MNLCLSLKTIRSKKGHVSNNSWEDIYAEELNNDPGNKEVAVLEDSAVPLRSWDVLEIVVAEDFDGPNARDEVRNA